WTKLIFNEGQSVSKNNFGATFFILTGFHGCHVFGGVTYLSAVLGRAVRGTGGAIIMGFVGAAATLVVIAITSHMVSGFVAVPGLPTLAIGLVLVVLAATKAALVALFYMHLSVEKRTLTYIAVTPAVLCVLLIFALLPDLGAITRALTHAERPAAAAHAE